MDNDFHYNPDEDNELEDVDYRRPRHEKEQEKKLDDSTNSTEDGQE